MLGSRDMSSEDETERRLSEVGKRVNDSPGHGKKKPKTKASDSIPAGSGTHLNLEAKSLIFAVFEKFKTGVPLQASRYRPCACAPHTMEFPSHIYLGNPVPFNLPNA